MIPPSRPISVSAMNLLKVRAPNGFSLPEVTIAVGIAALGLIALLGLMPQGLEMARKTGELAAQRQIVEQVTRDLEQTSWADLQQMSGATAGQIHAFSDQGMEVPLNHQSTSYIANVRVYPLTAQLPQGTAATPLTENYLRKVVIRIATTTNTGYQFDNPNNRFSFATYHTYVARSR